MGWCGCRCGTCKLLSPLAFRSGIIQAARRAAETNIRADWLAAACMLSWAPSAQSLPARLPLPAVFCCLPHATTQEVVKELPQHVKVVDLSADFRLRDVATYAEW